MIETVLTTRRDLLIAPLLAALPVALSSREADAAGPDPTMTIVTLPQEIVWVRAEGFPENSVEQAPLWSKTSESGLYYVLVRWYPGYISAPHWTRPTAIASSSPAPGG